MEETLSPAKPVKEVDDPPPEKRKCMDCGAETVGAYCHACGQHLVDGRLNLRMIGGWIGEQLFSLDRGLLLTVREMFLRPGEMIRAYVGGRRKRYTNPLTYLVLWAALGLLVTEVVGDTELRAYFSEVSEPSATMIGTLTGLAMLTAKYAGPLTAVACLPTALVLGLLFRSRSYNLAETLVFTLYVSGQVALVGTLISIASATAGGAPDSLQVAATQTLAVIIWAHATLGFYERSVVAVLKVWLAAFSSIVAMAALAGLAAAAYGRWIA